MDPAASESLGLSFSFSSIAAGIIYGGVGLWLFRIGRKDSNFRNIFIGMALLIYPYFVNGPLLTWGIGAALCGYAYYKRWD